MKTKLVKFLGASRYSTECTKCLQFRRYCSKNDDKSSKPSDEKTNEESSSEYLRNTENLIEFEPPEKKIHLSDYAKPLPEYLKEDMKNTFSFLKRRSITNRYNFPYDVEFLILGAGPIGSAVAFWLKKTLNRTIPVLVIDKDLSFNQPQNTSEVIEFA